VLTGFVIVKEDDRVSLAMADECILSGKKYGVDITAVPGVYSDFDNRLFKEGIRVNPLGHKKIRTNGVKGCFLSHFSLWKKCLELGHPIAIFEYDALLFNPLPDDILDRFNDYLNLDFSRHLYLKDLEKYETDLSKPLPVQVEKLQRSNEKCDPNGFKFINRNHIKGAYGYILKPSGAQKLIDAARTDGMLPADVLPNLKYLDLFYTVPSIVRLNPMMLRDLTGLSHTKKDF
jgi:GR25 family glycosyltransferase involved in LPS biosynthesis